MRRLGIVAGCLIAGLTLVLVGAPLLMVMVLIGGQADIEELCGPESDVALAAGSTDLDQAQLENASAVIAEGRRLEVPERAILVALAVAHQESGFRNYANDGVGGDLEADQQGIEASMELPHDAVGTDHGSLGVFQQQWPWWGSMPELMDPTTAARKFYSALLEVPGWASMEVTEAGQAVQRSAFPDAYADDVDLASSLLGAGPSADAEGQPAVYYGGMAGGGCSGPSDVTGQVVQPLPASASYVDQANWGNSGAHWESTHTGTDFSAACGTPVRASTDGVVTVRTDQAWSGRWLLQITTPNGGVTTWYAHMQDLLVDSGDRVTAGQPVGEVGTLGNSTGCHLHFEVRTEEAPEGVDPTQWLAENVGTSLGGDAWATQVAGDDAEVLREAATILTANVPFTLSERRAQAQIRRLLKQKPDVLLLQEVKERDVGAIVREIGGSWATWQPPGPRGASAIVWDTSKFRAARRGSELGFRGRDYSRWMPWVLLESDRGTLPVVAVHMPTNSSKSRLMAGYFREMTASYQRLVSEMSSAGYPPVVGGDWNHPLDREREPWSPVPQLERVGLTTNWRVGRPCAGTSERGGRIDGFAFHPGYLQVVDQGCLPRGASDHRPVWVAVAPAG